MPRQQLHKKNKKELTQKKRNLTHQKKRGKPKEIRKKIKKTAIKKYNYIQIYLQAVKQV